MPKSRHPHHGSGKKPKPKPQPKPEPANRMAEANRLGEVLRRVLTPEQLIQLKGIIEESTENAAVEAAKVVTIENYKRFWAIAMRVLIDRHAFEREDLNLLFAAWQEYLRDIESGLITTREMLDTLAYEDHISLDWECVEDSG